MLSIPLRGSVASRNLQTTTLSPKTPAREVNAGISPLVPVWGNFDDYSNKTFPGKSVEQHNFDNLGKILKNFRLFRKVGVLSGVFGILLLCATTLFAAELRRTVGSRSVSQPTSSPSQTEAVGDLPSSPKETRASVPIAWESDYHSATEKARQSKKMLLIYFTAESQPRPLTERTPQTSSESGQPFASSSGTSSASAAAKKPASPIQPVSYSHAHTSGESTLRGSRFPERLDAIAASPVALCRRFEKDVLESEELAEYFVEIVPVKIPVDSPTFAETKFAEMVRQPGLAMIDYRDESAPHFGEVVSVFPFLKGKAYDSKQVRTMMTLPAGSLSQRSLIYAVRVHPERPASTNSEHSSVLLAETVEHCEYMARVRVQGHQHFDSRFRRITSRMPDHEISEVCAESWPGESVLEAAIDCVDCWRQSSGHWRGVSARNSFYAYDMRKGQNGIWYATGLFAK